MKHSTALLAGVAALALSAGSALAQVSDDVVKIGVLNDQSGTYADLAGPGSTLAAQMAVEDFGGTVLGKKIEVVFADHQNKPDVGSSIVNRWIDAEQVDVVVDVPTSSVALAVQEITNRKGKVHLNSTAATSDLTGKACSPTGVHWTYSTTALANGTGKAIVAQGGKNWFFLTADYAFGHALERDVSKVVKEAGGEVKGVVRHPFPNQDFSSFLLQAQASGAQVIGLANAGADTINSIKQAGEFGITQAGQKLAGLLVFLSDIHSLGLDTAQGLQLTTGFYWDMDDEARAWSKKFAARHNGAMPTMAQAGVYSAVAHYLKAIKEAGTDDGKKVVDKMKELPVKDFFARNASLRADGRMVHDMYLVEVKKPSESKGPWDYYKVLRTISGEEAYGPMSPACSLAKG
ncbi:MULTISPECIES: ABC transporter substrate-binding protein [Oceanibaculum]|uniref:ABC transporter substrate-binding protein n=1 Tax=Oceanibaculum TaxID=659693 RepID=UPI0002E1C488|nr:MULTISPECIES: ABC transporter substrate-binding protein [Oceanibaculum]MCH2395730.1 ABC transporter substrate-binding protein [Oceanibaculum sp.]